MRAIRPSAHRVMPWRNGGGTTAEIFVEPPSSAGGEPFLYRVSIAAVELDGPFSRFAGCERHIVLVAGVGMTLDAGSHGRVELRPFEPARFSGDWDVHGTLHDGPVRDFNLIVDRSRASSSITVHATAETRPVDVRPGETCCVHVLEGRIVGAETGDTLLLDAPCDISPCGPARWIEARVIARDAGAIRAG